MLRTILTVLFLGAATTATGAGIRYLLSHGNILLSIAVGGGAGIVGTIVALFGFAKQILEPIKLSFEVKKLRYEVEEKKQIPTGPEQALGHAFFGGGEEIWNPLSRCGEGPLSAVFKEQRSPTEQNVCIGGTRNKGRRYRGTLTAHTHR